MGPDRRSQEERGRQFTDSDLHVAQVQPEQLEHRQVLPMMVTREAHGTRRRISVRQAGTWGPLPQCLHLDTPLLQQGNHQELKITLHAQLGQILHKRYEETKKPSWHF